MVFRCSRRKYPVHARTEYLQIITTASGDDVKSEHMILCAGGIPANNSLCQA
jgi:hypothetical protein